MDTMSVSLSYRWFTQFSNENMWKVSNETSFITWSIVIWLDGSTCDIYIKNCVRDSNVMKC